MDRIILIVDKCNYEILKYMDRETSLPVIIVDIYEIDAPDAVLSDIKAKPIEMIGEIYDQNFDYIVGFMDNDEVLNDLMNRLKMHEQYLGLYKFKEKYFDKKMKMQYLKYRIKVGSGFSTDEICEISDYTYCVGLKVLSEIQGVMCRVGKFCSFSDNVRILLGEEHRADWITTYPFNLFLENYGYIEGHPASRGDVIIGNDVWIGMDVKILSGISIGDGCVIGAGSVVTKSIPAYTIAAGNPARIIRKRFDEETIKILLEMKWWDWPEEMIYDAIPLLQNDDYRKLHDYYLENVKGRMGR